MSEDVEIEEVEVIEEEKVSIVEKVKVHFEKNQQRYAYVAGVVTATITLSVIAAAARRPHYIVNYITIKMNPHMTDDITEPAEEEPQAEPGIDESAPPEEPSA